MQEFILRVKRKGELEHFIGRRYGDFNRLHKRLRTELPGKILPPMPKKNKQSSTTINLLSPITGGHGDETSSMSSVSTMQSDASPAMKNLSVQGKICMKNIRIFIADTSEDHRRSGTAASFGRASPRSSVDGRPLTPATPTTQVRLLDRGTDNLLRYFSPLRYGVKTKGSH